MMDAEVRVVDPEEVSVEITMTMKLRDWIEVQNQLEGYGSSLRFKNLIANMVNNISAIIEGSDE